MSAMTLSQFASLPDTGVQHEMNAGELLTSPPAKSSKILLDYLYDKNSEVFSSAGYVLSTNPLTVRQPDISVLSKARLTAAAADSYFQESPELAIEIVSPSDGAEQMQAEVHQYLQFGSLQIWVLYPKTREMHIYHADATVTILCASETLTDCPVLPGLSIPITSLFPSTIK